MFYCWIYCVNFRANMSLPLRLCYCISQIRGTRCLLRMLHVLCMYKPGLLQCCACTSQVYYNVVHVQARFITMWCMYKPGSLQCGACTSQVYYNVVHVQARFITMWCMHKPGLLQCCACTSQVHYNVVHAQARFITMWCMYKPGLLQCGACTSQVHYNGKLSFGILSGLKSQLVSDDEVVL